jgi:hypothetical protein
MLEPEDISVEGWNEVWSLERAKASSEEENEITRDFESDVTREDFERSRVDSSRDRESTVREFASSSSTVV